MASRSTGRVDSQQQTSEWRADLAQETPAFVIEKVQTAIGDLVTSITRIVKNEKSSFCRISSQVEAVTAATSAKKQNRISVRIDDNLSYCYRFQPKINANVAYHKVLPMIICCLEVACGQKETGDANLDDMELYDSSFYNKIQSLNQVDQETNLSTLLSLKHRADLKVETFTGVISTFNMTKNKLAENSTRAAVGGEVIDDTTDMETETDHSFDEMPYQVAGLAVNSEDDESVNLSIHSAIEPQKNQDTYPTPTASSSIAAPIAAPADIRVIQMVDLEIFAGSIDAQTWEIFKMQGDLELICQHIYNELYETIGENVEKINQEWPPKLQLTSRLINEALADPSTANYKRARKLRSQVSRTYNWVGQCLANIMSNVAYNKMPHEVFKTLDLVIHGDGVRMTGADGVVTLYKNFDVNDPKFAIHVERAQRRHNMVKQAVDRASSAVAALIILYNDTKPMLDKWKWEIPPAGSFKQVNVPAAGPSSSRR